MTRGKSQSPTSAAMREPVPPFPAQKLDQPGLESELDPSPRWRAPRYRAAKKLEGQVAIVTGGDSGIGRAISYLYAREGADVVIVCLPGEQSDARITHDAIEAEGRSCMVITGDLTVAAFCDEVIKKTMKKFDRIDLLVHNAAWQNRKKVTELDEEELDRTLKTNVYAYLRLARAAVPHMKPGSSILSTGSVVGLRGSEEMGDYGASKGAIHAITKSLAKELMDKRIRVNCVAPGPVWTPLNPADTGLSPSEVAEFGKESSPMERPAQPEEIAPAFVFLASNADSSYVNGVVLPITGGPP